MKMKRKRIGKKLPKHSLPEELCREILSLLPVKSLLRFRAVSTSWRSLIDDPDFARLHLARFPNNRHESHLFAVQYDPDLSRECALRRSRDFRIMARLGSFGADRVNGIVASIDGLFMLKKKKCSAADRVTPEEEVEFVLWNHSIRKTLILPPSPEFSKAQEFGLGFDPSIKDYKYVRFSRNYTAVYTLGSNSWKTIQQGSLLFDLDRLHGHLGRTVCFKGYLVAPARYPIENNFSMTVLLFDLHNEAYASIDFPGDSDPNDKFRADGLTIADGGRTMQLVCLSFRKGSVWALEGDLGRDVKSWVWIQRHTFALTMAMERDIGWVRWGDRFLHLNKNGVVLFRAEGRVISFNLETQEEKHRKKNVCHTWPYMESLILH